MSKKLFCLALALMMLVCATAFAAPSKTTNDVTSKYVGDTSAYAADFAINAKEESAAATAVLDAILAYAETNTDIVKVFGDDVVDAIKALLADVDVDTLDVGELFPLNIANYDAAYGDVKVSFKTNTAENTVVALLGVVEAADTTWCALETEVEDGEVVVTFTEEVLSAIPAGADLVLVFLNTPVAE